MANVPSLSRPSQPHLLRFHLARPRDSAIPLDLGILKRPISLWFLLLCVVAFHGPMLAMRLPAGSYDANFHMSMAANYAEHWFDPWNPKAFAGFSEATYPPLTHQWIAMLSHIVGLTYGFMMVQGTVILLLPIAVYQFALLWTDKRSASYGAFCSIFLGSLALLVYLDGQIGTTSSATLYLLALPYFYRYVVDGTVRELPFGVSIACTAAAAHHATLIFGLPLFVLPLVWLAMIDVNDKSGSRLAALGRVGCFFTLTIVGVLLILTPYLLALIKHPIDQIVIPHTSRANYILNPVWGVHYFLLPYGPVALAIPFIFFKGAERRLRPLLFGFYLAFLLGLGGTTPIAKLLLGRAFDVLTLERFSFYALLLAMPFMGMAISKLVDRFQARGALVIAVAIIGWGAFAASWNRYFPLLAPPPDVQPIIRFLNEKDHARYRYLTLGYPNSLSAIMPYTNASSVDGEYNSGRTLPELTSHAVAQLTTARFYGADGIAALREMLQHAHRYGLRYIFVHDHSYDPLLAFAGWRPLQKLDGNTVVWGTIGIPPATPIASPLRPPRWQGVMWGIFPFGASLVTISLFLFFRQREGEIADVLPSTALVSEAL